MYAYIMQFGRLLSKPPQAVLQFFVCILFVCLINLMLAT